jgi:hypothetical protein
MPFTFVISLCQLFFCLFGDRFEAFSTKCQERTFSIDCWEWLERSWTKPFALFVGHGISALEFLRMWETERRWISVRLTPILAVVYSFGSSLRNFGELSEATKGNRYHFGSTYAFHFALSDFIGKLPFEGARSSTLPVGGSGDMKVGFVKCDDPAWRSIRLVNHCEESLPFGLPDRPLLIENTP